LNLDNKKSEDEITRTLVLIDATGSMGALIDNTKSCIGDIFNHVRNTLVDAGFSPKLF
jgi:hypothetical protein